MSVTQFSTNPGYHSRSMLSTPRISGSLLKSLARLARTRAGSSALQLALRAALKIIDLADLPSSMFGPVPLDNRAISARSPRRLEDAKLPLPRPPWSKTSAEFAAAYEKRRTTPERIASRVLECARELERMSP